MVKTWNIAIPELTGREKRRAYLYLPTMYRDQPAAAFPVLYMFDGHNVFFDSHATHGKSWGLSEYLDFFDVPLIVARRGMQSSSRQRPPLRIFALRLLRSRIRCVTGRGDITMEWLVNTFKPSIDPALAHHSLARADLHCRQLHGRSHEPSTP